MFLVVALGSLVLDGALAGDRDNEQASDPSTALLDRWTDDPPEGRLARASELFELKLRDHGGAETAVEVARLRLARKDWSGAADLARAQLQNPAIRARSAAIVYLALVESATQTLVHESGEDRERTARAYFARRRRLSQELVAAVGSDALGKALVAETSRREYLRSLDSLGRPLALPLGTPLAAASGAIGVTVVDYVAPDSHHYLEDLKREAALYEKVHAAGASLLVVCVAPSREQATSALAGVPAPWERRFFASREFSDHTHLPLRCVLDVGGRVRFTNVWGGDLVSALDEIVLRAPHSR